MMTKVQREALVSLIYQYSMNENNKYNEIKVDKKVLNEYKNIINNIEKIDKQIVDKLEYIKIILKKDNKKILNLSIDRLSELELAVCRIVIFNKNKDKNKYLKILERYEDISFVYKILK